MRDQFLETTDMKELNNERKQTLKMVRLISHKNGKSMSPSITYTIYIE